MPVLCLIYWSRISTTVWDRRNADDAHHPHVKLQSIELPNRASPLAASHVPLQYSMPRRPDPVSISQSMTWNSTLPEGHAWELASEMGSSCKLCLCLGLCQRPLGQFWDFVCRTCIGLRCLWTWLPGIPFLDRFWLGRHLCGRIFQVLLQFQQRVIHTWQWMHPVLRLWQCDRSFECRHRRQWGHWMDDRHERHGIQHLLAHDQQHKPKKLWNFHNLSLVYFSQKWTLSQYK